MYHLTIIHPSICLPIHPYLSIIIYLPSIHPPSCIINRHPSMYVSSRYLCPPIIYLLSVIYPCTYPSVFSSICLSVHPLCMYLPIRPPSPFTRSSIHLAILAFIRVYLLRSSVSFLSPTLHSCLTQPLGSPVSCLVPHPLSCVVHFNQQRGGGNGNPLQDSCLENPADGGAWPVTVHGVAEESDTAE